MVPTAAQEASTWSASSGVFERDSLCSIRHLLPEQCAALFLRNYEAGPVHVNDMLSSSGWCERLHPVDL